MHTYWRQLCQLIFCALTSSTFCWKVDVAAIISPRNGYNRVLGMVTWGNFVINLGCYNSSHFLVSFLSSRRGGERIILLEQAKILTLKPVLLTFFLLLILGENSIGDTIHSFSVRLITGSNPADVNRFRSYARKKILLVFSMSSGKLRIAIPSILFT